MTRPCFLTTTHTSFTGTHSPLPQVHNTPIALSQAQLSVSPTALLSLFLSHLLGLAPVISFLLVKVPDPAIGTVCVFFSSAILESSFFCCRTCS